MPTREAILEALTECVTQDEAVAALADADAYLADHPNDLDLAHVMEGAAMVRDAWDLSLGVWPQADRDELLRRTGRMVN